MDSFCGVAGAGLYAVFDGHGGGGASEFCRDHFADALEDALGGKGATPAQPLAALEEATDAAYAAVDEAMKPTVPYAGTTAVTALITQNEAGERVLTTANVGDARAVLIHKGKAIRLTVDHDCHNADEVARIEALGGRIINGRVNGQVAPTRALGDHLQKKYLVPVPHRDQRVLTKDDTHLLLACDGVFEVLEDQTVVDIIIKADSADAAAKAVVQASLDAWTTDNISAMVLTLPSA